MAAEAAAATDAEAAEAAFADAAAKRARWTAIFDGSGIFGYCYFEGLLCVVFLLSTIEGRDADGVRADVVHEHEHDAVGREGE